MDCIINLTYIRELTDDDPVLLKDFIAEIIDQLKETDILIQQYWEAHNIAGIAAAAHKLKSSIKSVGAHPLYERLQELESLVTKESTADEIVSLLKVVRRLSKSCEEKLSAAL